MSDGTGALTLLGESADWLKDAEGASIRDHRLAAVEAYEAAWSNPLDNDRQAALQAAFGRLFDALRYNHLYPDGVILGTAGAKSVRYLVAAGTFRKDFDLLRNLCVVNKFGIGEAHLLHMVLLLGRMALLPKVAYDHLLERGIGDIILLRVPIYRADNLAPFSDELKARFHAVRLLRCMGKLGLIGEGAVELTAQDNVEAHALLDDELRSAASLYIQRPHRLAFSVFDTATALEEYARAHAAGRAPLDERSPEELWARLRHRMRQLAARTDIGPVCKGRLTNLGIAAVARAMAHVDMVLARDIYAFLRGDKYKPTVRHSRMFELLPNNAERLKLLNMLFVHGKQNPAQYAEKFQPYFGKEKLRFVSKEAGFSLSQGSA